MSLTMKLFAPLIAVVCLAAPASAQKPSTSDLIVEDIAFDQIGNEVRLKVKNQGTGRADDTYCRLVISVSAGNGPPKILFTQERHNSSIGAGKTDNEDFDVNFAQIQTQAVQHRDQLLAAIDKLPLPIPVKNARKAQIMASFRVQVVATADSRNEVAELNETNNNRTEASPLN
jgi:hypothetical protein